MLTLLRPPKEEKGRMEERATPRETICTQQRRKSHELTWKAPTRAGYEGYPRHLAHTKSKASSGESSSSDNQPVPRPRFFLTTAQEERRGDISAARSWHNSALPASLAPCKGTYCYGSHCGLRSLSRPHSQCLRYLRCCPLGMYPERRRVSPDLVWRVLCCGKDNEISAHRRQ